ncbi:MAG: hypothetical protein ACR2KK_02720 [Acidimicrobiales bacterium]
MTCEPDRPCGDVRPRLGVVPSPPGLRYLERRTGDFWSFLDDLVARTEGTPAGGAPLGSRWDIEGDPRAHLLAELWAYVAETVAAYTELSANEAYLGTASDWTDLRRLAGLVGYRPRPPVAAQGWVQIEIDKGTNPLVPAGTRVQASAVPPARPRAETFEVAETTQLRAEWAGLTATWVPQPAPPVGREMRFLGDPGFRVGDRVLFVLEQNPGPVLPVGYTWFQYWEWLLALYGLLEPPDAVPVALARVEGRRGELGTTLVTFDRDLDAILAGNAQPYAAYCVTATAGSARRVSKVLKVPALADATSPASASVPASTYDVPSALTSASVVLDAALDDVSAHQVVAVVDWDPVNAGCDVVPVQAHVPVSWEVAPGSPTRVSKLTFGADLGTLEHAQLPGRPVTVYVLGPRVVARHYTFPPTSSTPQLRLFPAPSHDPERIAVRTTTAGTIAMEVLRCARALVQEAVPPSGLPAVGQGLIVDLLDGPPQGSLTIALASANLAPVRHGATRTATLGSGDAAAANQRFPVADAPVAADLDSTGAPVSTLVVSVDGRSWDAVPTRYVAGPDDEVYSARLAPDGGVVVEAGDGVKGRRVPTGRNNVTASYRVGGGLGGEVPAGAIDSLVGSVRGVKKVTGAGPTAGGADQDDERRLRSLVPSRTRAFGRAVSREDLVDLSLAYPGVSHAAAWHGAGPPGCPCGGQGLHLAFLRAAPPGAAGVAPPAARPPLPPEVASLSSFLDGRRDATVPICVCPGVASELGLSAVLVVDPRRHAPSVVDAAKAVLAEPEGPLSPAARVLAQPLDRSDVLTVLHGVPGVVGVTGLALTGGTVGGDPGLGRRLAARYELLLLPTSPILTAVQP